MMVQVGSLGDADADPWRSIFSTMDDGGSRLSFLQTRARLSIYAKKQNGGSASRFSDWMNPYDFHILLLGFFGLDFELFFVLCFPKFAGFVRQVFSNTWVPKGTGLPGDHEIRW